MKEFFQKLAIRLNSENNISDMTWALCESNISFRNIFLDFCFDNAISQGKIESIEREFSEKGLRPDFLITDSDGKRYLLEVKKFDQDLHKEYKKLKNIEKSALIANYSVEKQDIYHYTRTWHSLIEHLTKAMRDNNMLNTQIINGYLDYLISVTGYFKGVTMNLTNLCSLHIFLKTINVIAKQSLIEKFGIKEKEIKIIKDACGDHWSGICIKFKKSGKVFDVWFGVIYKYDEKVYISIQFTDKCSEFIFDKVNNDCEYDEDGKYFIKYDNKDEICQIKIKDIYFEKLKDDKQKYTDQESILKNYFEEVFCKLIPI